MAPAAELMGTGVTVQGICRRGMEEFSRQPMCLLFFPTRIVQTDDAALTTC